MDYQRTTGTLGRLRFRGLQMLRPRFGLRLMLLLVALVAICLATYLVHRALWKLNDPKLAAARDAVIDLKRERKSWEAYARDQNRLHDEENWFQRAMRTSDSHPYSEKDIQIQLKQYDEATAEAEKKLRDIEQQ